jgi:hypothetical protein
LWTNDEREVNAVEEGDDDEEAIGGGSNGVEEVADGQVTARGCGGGGKTGWGGVGESSR